MWEVCTGLSPSAGLHRSDDAYRGLIISGGLGGVFSGIREGAVQVPKWILDVLTGKKLRVHELRAPVWVGHRELMLLSMDVRDDENPLSLTAGVLGLFSAALADVFTWSRGSELSYPLTSANGDAWRVCVDAAVLAVIDAFSSELEVSVEAFVSEAGIPWLATLANNGFRPESVIRGTDEVFVATLLNLLKYEVKHRCGDRWRDVWRRLDR